MVGCVLGLGVFLGACSSTPNSSGLTVNVYSARHYDSDAQLFTQFTKETGIKVNLVEGKDDELLERIKSEGKNSPADVFITVDAGRLWRAQQKDLFQPVTSQVLTQRIPANLRHPQGLWFGLTKRARVIAYNKAKVQPQQIKKYEDLTQPQWQKQVCVRSSNNVYNQSLLGSMVASQGEAATEVWAKGLVKNFARPPQGGDIDQIKAVAVGECQVALVNHYYYLRMQHGTKEADRAIAAKVGLIFPNQADRGTHVNISGAGLVAHAPHREAGIKLIEFLSGAAAQKIFAEGSDEYPVVTDAAMGDRLKALGAFKSDAVNVSAYGSHNEAVVKIADRAGWK